MMQKRIRLLGLFMIIVTVLSLGLSFAPAAEAYEWGVDTATTPPADWVALPAGEGPWYAFDYAGDGTEIQVKLQAVPAGSVDLMVWSPRQIERWEVSHRLSPIGRGGEDPFVEGGLIWSSSSPEAGTYYVVVEQAEGFTGQAWYLLEIEGQSVTFSAPTAQETEPAATDVKSDRSTNSAPKSPLVSELEGTLVFQTTYGGPFYTINVDGSDLQRITNGIDPVWSPDGEQIAFVRWEEPRGVWVINADGSNAHRVFDWSETRYPSWSPDGQEIVFSRTKGGGGGGGFPGGVAGMSGDVGASAGRPPEGSPPGGSSSAGGTLGIVNASDGSFWEPLPASVKNLTPDWSPAGDQIVIAANFSNRTGLIVQSVDGSMSWQLTSDPYDTTPTWSPDGTKVAFIRRQHDHWEIYVIDVATGQQTRLTDTPALDGVAASSVSPAWSPDGEYIVYLTDQTGQWEIWAMKADGSEQAPLFRTELDGLTLDYAFASERALDWTW
jgi:Tol biopolymer transport system component